MFLHISHLDVEFIYFVEKTANRILTLASMQQNEFDVACRQKCGDMLMIHLQINGKDKVTFCVRTWGALGRYILT